MRQEQEGLSSAIKCFTGMQRMWEEAPKNLSKKKKNLTNQNRFTKVKHVS